MTLSNKKICEDAPTRQFLRELKPLREGMGYTREELARKIEVRPRTLKDYELQTRQPVLGRLLKLAEVLNYDLSRSLNYKYYHGKISLITIRRRMVEKGITPQTLSKLTGYSLRMVYDTLIQRGTESLSCLDAVLQVLRGSPRNVQLEPQVEKKFTPSLLRRMREKSGLPQREIARRIGVTRATISNYERGNNSPENKRWVKLYEILKHEITVHKMFEFEMSQRYRIYTANRLGRVPQEHIEYEFIYEGKRGPHHIFREQSGGWMRTYTDAQLIGKTIKEVCE